MNNYIFYVFLSLKKYLMIVIEEWQKAEDQKEEDIVLSK